jgi:polyhydroxybutyrate depolymerase
MKRLIWVLFLLVGVVAVHAQEVEPEPLTITVDDLERTYWLHVPDNLDEPAPLVIVLHGRGGTGRHIQAYTEFDALADTEGFITVYPDGIDYGWDFVRNIPGYTSTYDDTAFLIALLDQIAAEYPVDLSRVYMAGFSNGGFMTQRVACENPTRFAAFASVAASGFGGMRQVCLQPGAETAPMLLMHGTYDNIVLWDGMSITRGERTVRITYPVPETLAYWAEFNSCQPEAQTKRLPVLGMSPGTNVRVLTVVCPEDASVVLYTIVNGGHNWPGHPRGIPAEVAGNVNRDIDANREIWKFFEQHQRVQAEDEATPEAEG